MEERVLCRPRAPTDGYKDQDNVPAQVEPMDRSGRLRALCQKCSWQGLYGKLAQGLLELKRTFAKRECAGDATQLSKETEATMIWFKSCRRCRTGDVTIDMDMYGWYVLCLHCGYMKDLDHPDQAARSARRLVGTELMVKSLA